MVFRKAAAPGHRSDPHACVVSLCQCDDFVPRAVPVGCSAHHECRALACFQRSRDPGNQFGLRTRSGAHDPGRNQLCALVPVVDGHRNQDRAARRHHGQVVGPGDRKRHVFCTGGLDAPFDVGLRQFGRLGRRQERVEGKDRTRLLPGRDHHGRAVLVGGEDVAHGVAHAGRRVKVHERSVSSSLRVAVCHADHAGFLQTEDVAEVAREVAEHRKLGRPWIREHGGHPEAAHQVEHGLADGGGVCCGLRGRCDNGIRYGCGHFVLSCCAPRTRNAVSMAGV